MSTKNLNLKFAVLEPAADSSLSYVWQMWKHPWVLKSVIKNSFLSSVDGSNSPIYMTVTKIIWKLKFAFLAESEIVFYLIVEIVLILFKRERCFGGTKRENDLTIIYNLFIICPKCNWSGSQWKFTGSQKFTDHSSNPRLFVHVFLWQNNFIFIVIIINIYIM